MSTSQSISFDLSDVKQFENVFKERFSSLCNYAYKLLSDQSKAEDAVQQVFSKLWEKRNQLHVEGSIKSYLYRATYNTCMNEIKRNKKLSSLDTENTLKRSSEKADTLTRMQELERNIQEGLQQLPEKCRAIFVMSRYENLKYKEIADMLEISIKTVENQMGKALKMMRVHLKEFISILILLMLGK